MKNKLIVFEGKILIRIFGPKKNEDGGYEIRTNRYGPWLYIFYPN